MIQDISPHKINNEYRKDAIACADSPLLVFDGKTLLCRVSDDGALAFPTCGQLSGFSNGSVPGMELTYLFALDGIGFFYARHTNDIRLSGFEYHSIDLFRTAQPKELAYAAVTAYHLSVWYGSNVYCGRCGAKTVHDDTERMLRCPVCGSTIYPKIMPSVIVAVTNGDKLLLEQYNRPGAKLGALVAGFSEIGETVEETVAREVKEECGLDVTDIRFYKSQPWGISGGGLLFGFWCRVTGDDTVRPDGVEIADARWVTREWLQSNYTDTGIALTGEMIAAFRDGNEYSKG